MVSDSVFCVPEGMKEPRLKDCIGLSLHYKIFHVSMLVSIYTLQSSVSEFTRETSTTLTLK
jgi:hypothetical protein